MSSSSGTPSFPDLPLPFAQPFPDLPLPFTPPFPDLPLPVSPFPSIPWTIRYNVDPDKTILAGFSMGGAGAWHIGAHYPLPWAGVHTGAGFAETCRYNSGEGKWPLTRLSLCERSLSITIDAPGRGGCSRMTELSSTAEGKPYPEALEAQPSYETALWGL